MKPVWYTTVGTWLADKAVEASSMFQHHAALGQTVSEYQNQRCLE